MAIEPFVVIIHDFPKFLSEYIHTNLFSFRFKVTPKFNVNIRDKELKSILFGVRNSVTAKLRVLLRMNAKLKINASCSPKMKIRATTLTKLLGFKFNVNSKIKQKGTGTVRVGRHKAYLDPNGYYIGVPYTLGDWDGPTNATTLGDLDDLTMQEMTLREI